MVAATGSSSAAATAGQHLLKVSIARGFGSPVRLAPLTGAGAGAGGGGAAGAPRRLRRRLRPPRSGAYSRKGGWGSEWGGGGPLIEIFWDSRDLCDLAQQTVAGFGLDLALRPGLGVVVTAVARNGAAAKARTPRAGDVITRINRQPVAGLSLDAVRDLLRGTTVARIAFIPADQLSRK